MRDRGRVGVPAAVAVVLGALFLAAPALGTDLSAQVARAEFFAAYGWAPIDFGWYGGVSPHGYSLVSPPLMAWLGGGTLGPRLLGALAVLVGTLAFTALLIRTSAARPVLGGAVGAACMVGNLVSGRITYALGVAVGLGALVALTSGRRWVRFGVAPAVAGLAAAASPVAGLFVGLAGTAWAVPGLLRASRHDRPPTAAAAIQAAPRVAVHTPSGTASSRAVEPVSPHQAGVHLAAPAVRSEVHAQEASRSGRRWSRVGEGAALAAGAAVPAVAMAALFGVGGWMNISRWDTARAAVAGLVVALLVARPAVRVGALLAVGGVLAAYAVHTPVGLNATRLAAMFTLPVLAAYADFPPRVGNRPGAAATQPAGRRTAPRAVVLVAVFAAVAVWQPPVMVADLRAAGDPAARPGYFQPLNAELARRGPVGRVEVVPLTNYWDAAYVPPAAPLARGWLRQADLAYNPLFFDGTLDAAGYERWLRDNGVAYVAVADAKPSWVGRAEAALVRGGLPYLTRVWRGGAWTLYEVSGRPSILPPDPAPDPAPGPAPGSAPGSAPHPPPGSGPGAGGGAARLVASTPGGVLLDAPAGGDIAIRVRWSRFLAVRPATGACLRPDGDWTTLAVSRPGRYEVTSSLTDRGPFCP